MPQSVFLGRDAEIERMLEWGESGERFLLLTGPAAGQYRRGHLTVGPVHDTGIYGAVVLPSRPSTRALRERYAPHLLGRRLVLSFQTVAELR